MKIYINGRFLTQKITGVQRYAREITLAIDKTITEKSISINHKFILFTPCGDIDNLNLSNIEIKQVGNLHGHLWEQLELPWYSKDGFLLSMCNCAPILKRNQAVTIHDAAISAMPKSFSLLFRIWYRMLYFFAKYNAKTIFTVSEFSKGELNKWYSIPLDKIVVTYNGIDHIHRIKKDKSIIDRLGISNIRYVFAVSSLNPSKNFQLVLKAAERIPKVKFIIAGGMNNKVFAGNNWNVPNNVQFIGYVTDEELMALYEHAACFVYPSLYEGFGIPPLEAMMCGCPVIVSDRASLPEVCGDMAMYCDAYDEKALADKIKTVVYENKGIVSNKEKILDKYDWKKSGKVLLDNILKCSLIKKRCE